MYSALFRELCAARIQLDICSMEAQLAETTNQAQTSAEDCSKNDVTSRLVAPTSIMEQQSLGTNDQLTYASLLQAAANGATVFQIPVGWGSFLAPFTHNGVDLSHSAGFCLSGYTPASDATQHLTFNGNLGQHNSNRPDFGYQSVTGAQTIFSEATLDPATIATMQHQQQLLQLVAKGVLPQHFLETGNLGSIVEETNPGCRRTGFEVKRGSIEVTPSSSSSSSTSSSSLSSTDVTMSAAAAAATAAIRSAAESESEASLMQSSDTMMLKHHHDDDEEGSDPDDSAESPKFSHRYSPQRTAITAARHEEGVPPPALTRLQEALVESSSDEEGRPPSALGGAFDRRRGSLGGGGVTGNGRDSVDGEIRFNRTEYVPSQMRRLSTPCISVASSKGLRGAPAPHLLQRPSAALDYESLKVRLEKLTGPVTEGARKDGAGSKAVDRGRRTSLVALPTPAGLTGPGASALTPSTGISHHDDGQTGTEPGIGEASGAEQDSAQPPPVSKTDAAAAALTDEEPQNSRLCFPISQVHLQNHHPPNCGFENPSDDSSSSAALSSSSSSTSSSSLDKFRLQCVIEHVLQFDPRLQEIIKRHESEREFVRKKHRLQWVELEKLLTQKFGDEWKNCINIPELSFISTLLGGNTSVQNHPEDFPDSRQPNRINDDQTSTFSTSLVEHLRTIREGQIEDYCTNGDMEHDPKSSLNGISHHTRQPVVGLLPDDCSKPAMGPTMGVVTGDDPTLRRRSEGSIELLQKKIRPWPSLLGQNDRPKSAQSNGESTETRLSHNIANCLAKSQFPIGILNPSSSRLHRHTVGLSTKDVTMVPSTTLKSSSHPDTSQAQILSRTFNGNGYIQTNTNILLSQLYQNLLMVNQAPPLVDPTISAELAWARLKEDSTIARESSRGENENDQWTNISGRIPDTFSNEHGSKYSLASNEDYPYGIESTAQLSRLSELQELSGGVQSVQAPVAIPYSILPHLNLQHQSLNSLNSFSRIGWDMTPGMGLAEYGQNPLMLTSGPGSNLRELGGSQFLPFPWTVTSHSINSMLGLDRHDYRDTM